MNDISTISAETTVAGTHLRMEFDYRAPVLDEDERMEFMNSVVTAVCDAVADYVPTEDKRTETENAYSIAAHCLQLLDLARDSEETSPMQVKRYLRDMVDNLEVLEAWDPRFCVAYALASYAEQCAGHFDIEGVRELCNAIETWMPARLEEPVGLESYVVVDDLQTPAAFRASRMPDHDALRLHLVRAEDVESLEFNRTGRFVLPMPMFPDGSLSNMATVLRVCADGVMKVRFETDRPDFSLLCHVCDAAHQATRINGEYTPVEFYADLAYAQQLCALTRTPPFIEVPEYRERVMNSLYGALITLSKIDKRFDAPKAMMHRALDMTNNFMTEEAIALSTEVQSWLPGELTVYLPPRDIVSTEAELRDILIDRINEMPGQRTVTVRDEQTQAEFVEAGYVPDPEKFFPEEIEGDIGWDHLYAPNSYLYRADV